MDMDDFTDLSPPNSASSLNDSPEMTVVEDKSVHKENNKYQFHDKSVEGYTYRSTAIQYFNEGDFRKALEYHQLHLNIATDIADRAAEGTACASIGTTYFQLGYFEKAVEYHHRQLNISKELGDRSEEASACSNLGSDYNSLKDFTRAVEYYLLHVGIVKQVGDRLKEKSAYANIAMNYFCLRDFIKAIEYHRLQLSVAKQLGDRHGENSAYANLGIDYSSLGNYKKAVQYYKLHLSIVQEIGDRDREGRAYSNLGVGYRSLGDFKTALGYHEQQLRVANALGDKHEQGLAYSSIGSCYRFLGDHKNAVRNYDLDLTVSKEVGNKIGEERAYSNLSAVYCYLCDFQKAANYCQLHLRIAKEARNKIGEVKAYGRLGDVYHHLSNYEKAIEYHELALRISQEMEDKAEEAHAFQSLGRDHCAQGDLEKGVSYRQLHLSVAEKMGDKSEEGIAHYQLGNAYCSLADFGKAEDCYKLSVTMFDSLRNSQQSHEGWKGSLRYYHEDAYTALWKVLLKQGKNNHALLAADNGRRQSLVNLMESHYCLRFPQFVSSGAAETLNDISNYITSPTVFMVVDQREVYFWVLNKGRELHFIKNEIDIRYLTENVTASLVNLREDADSRTGVPESVKCEDRSLDELLDEALSDQGSGKKQSALSHGRQNDPLRVLYDMVIGPIEDVISGDEITFVPDGALFKAPFPAFKDKYSRYLFERFKIRLIPTLKSLKILKESPEQHDGTIEVLLIGDPWVENVCIGKKVQKNDKKKRKKSKGQRKVEEKRLSQLPAAKTEVEMIGNILETEPLTGKRATKTAVLRRLPSAQLVHIAAHAKAETGEIALSPNFSHSSEKPKEEDYLLTMKDVKNATMQAKLVVLSCCHSGRGEIRSESVVDFARTLLGAGAGSVLASLWATSDEATHTFMRNFYNHLAEGVSAGTCLNQAMKVMRESDRFNRVRDWAPFILIGDDVTLDLSPARMPDGQSPEE